MTQETVIKKTKLAERTHVVHSAQSSTINIRLSEELLEQENGRKRLDAQEYSERFGHHHLAVLGIGRLLHIDFHEREKTKYSQIRAVATNTLQGSIFGYGDLAFYLSSPDFLKTRGHDQIAPDMKFSDCVIPPNGFSDDEYPDLVAISVRLVVLTASMSPSSKSRPFLSVGARQSTLS